MDARLVSPMLNDMEQLLKKFSEMYESTGVKILASFLWVGPLLFFSYFFSQFVATIPINVSTDPQISADAKSISLSNLSGTTVIFDSFSSEDEVSERLIPGNVQAYTHTKFSVHVSGVVSAILSPSTAPSYKFAKNNKRRLADTKRQKKQAPVVVKQEAEPTSPPCEDTIDLTMINDLHMQIMKQKQRCAMLFSDQRYEVSRVFVASASCAHALCSQTPKESFASCLVGCSRTRPYSVSSSAASSSEVITCTVTMDEATAASVLQGLTASRP